MEIKVTKIEAKKELPSKTRVAVYARVSNGKDAMLHSLSSQVSYYNRMIQSHDDWLLVGVYADEALTGTKDTREEFQRLIQDALDGKIDLIVTKSISRFARNTLTLLETTRKLTKAGIVVYFEEERIYSNSKEGEMILTMLGSVAQEQSRSTSENMLWRIKKDLQEGIIWGGNSCLGYKLINRHLVLVPEEAELVKRIYRLYLEGNGDMKIARILNKEGIRTHEGGLWSLNSIRIILQNYNYTGDLILQKTFRENHLTKKRMLNNGEKDKYVVENDHEHIIPKAIFELAQKERKKRAKKISKNKSKTIHFFTGLLYCGYCHKLYRFKKNKYRNYWSCSTFEMHGKDYCNAKLIRNDVLEKITCDVLGMSMLDERILRKEIQRIDIFSLKRELIYTFKDSHTIKILYPEYSRKESWTPEKKKLARQRAFKQRQKEMISNG